MLSVSPCPCMMSLQNWPTRNLCVMHGSCLETARTASDESSCLDFADAKMKNVRDGKEVKDISRKSEADTEEMLKKKAEIAQKNKVILEKNQQFLQKLAERRREEEESIEAVKNKEDVLRKKLRDKVQMLHCQHLLCVCVCITHVCARKCVFAGVHIHACVRAHICANVYVCFLLMSEKFCTVVCCTRVTLIPVALLFVVPE